MTELVLAGLGLAIGLAVLAHSLAHTPATLLACAGGYAIAGAGFTGWTWLGAGGVVVLLIAALWTQAEAWRQPWLF